MSNFRIRYLAQTDSAKFSASLITIGKTSIRSAGYFQLSWIPTNKSTIGLLFAEVELPNYELPSIKAQI